MTTQVESNTQTQQPTDQFTDLPVELTDELTAAFVRAEDILRRRQQDTAARDAADAAAEQARISESWAAPLARLRAALPTWIHQYIEQPSVIYETRHFDEGMAWYEYSPARIVIPGCGLVAAWVGQDSIAYEPALPKLEQDEDYIWWVRQTLWQEHRNRHNLDRGETDIAVALLRARTNYLNLLALDEEAQARNDDANDDANEAANEAAAAVPMEPSATAQPDPIDQALALIDRLSRGERLMQKPSASVERNHTADLALTLAAVGIAIAHHISRLADAVEAYHA